MKASASSSINAGSPICLFACFLSLSLFQLPLFFLSFSSHSSSRSFPLFSTTVIILPVLSQQQQQPPPPPPSLSLSLFLPLFLSLSLSFSPSSLSLSLSLSLSSLSLSLSPSLPSLSLSLPSPSLFLPHPSLSGSSLCLPAQTYTTPNHEGLCDVWTGHA